MKRIGRKIIVLLLSASLAAACSVTAFADDQYSEEDAVVLDTVESESDDADEIQQTIDESDTQDMSEEDMSGEDIVDAESDEQEVQDDIEIQEDASEKSICLESADAITGSIVLKITGINVKEDETLTVPVWSKADQSDIVWYQAELKDDTYYVYANLPAHKYSYGTFNAHVYLKSGNSTTFECGTQFDINPQFESLNANVNDGMAELSLIGLEDYGAIGSISFAVWSDVNGQDDLKWYTASEIAKGNYVAAVLLSNHKGSGSYSVHCYAEKANGEKVFLGASSFKTIASSAKKITVGEIDDNGAFNISVKGIKAPTGIKAVKIAVWSTSNMSDITWYNAEKSGSDYAVNAKLENHKYHAGAYNIHVYLQNSLDEMEFLGSTGKNVAYKNSGLSITDVNGNEKQFDIKLANASFYGAKTEILYAVWSDVNGQDDLKWYNASNQYGVYDAIVNISDHKSAGKYNVHCYAKLPDGSTSFVCASTFTVSAPTCSDITFTPDKDTGTMELEVGKISSVSGIKNVYAEIWCSDDKSDLERYELADESDGYEAIINIAKHAYHTGIYHAKIITVDNNDITAEIGETRADMSIEKGTISVNQSVSKIYYPITLEDFEFCNSVKSVRIAVWSTEGGQDDLVWYDTTLQNDTYAGNIDLTNHMTAGEYNVHVYATIKDGSLKFINATNFYVASLPKEEVSVYDINQTEGTFKASITVLRSKENVSEVSAAVWSEENQGDVVWYTASMQADGTYKIDVDVKNHKTNFGEYKIHVYVRDKAGNMAYLAGTTCNIEPVNYTVCSKLSDSTMKITIYGAMYNGKAAAKVEFPTWSEGNNQSDIVWYNGTKNSDGSYSVNISRGDFKTDGKYFTHVYVTNSDGERGFAYGTEYELKSSDTYDSYAAEVMRNIIYAVETGGQVYGNARYNCFVPAYNSTKNECAITIGAGQWFATEAKKLLKQIRSEDPETFAKLDTANIGDDLDNANWSYYGTDLTSSTASSITSISEGRTHRTIVAGSAKATAIQNIISSDAGVKIQNKLVDEQMKTYVDRAESLGVSDLKARMFCANIIHLGGTSSLKRVLVNCDKDGVSYTMENIWNIMLKYDNQNASATQVGSPIFHSRHIKVMEWINKYIG